jgi:HSP20 family protein
MTIVRWQPRSDLGLFSQFRRLENDMERFFRGSDVANGETYAFPLDVFEEEKEYRVRADLPGLDKENIEVRAEDGALTIRASRKMENQDRRESYHVQERFTGEFSRTLRLPKNVDQGKISASYQNGVLEVTLPKSEEALPKMIDVKVS